PFGAEGGLGGKRRRVGRRNARADGLPLRARPGMGGVFQRDKLRPEPQPHFPRTYLLHVHAGPHGCLQPQYHRRAQPHVGVRLPTLRQHLAPLSGGAEWTFRGRRGRGPAQDRAPRRNRAVKSASGSVSKKKRTSPRLFTGFSSLARRCAKTSVPGSLRILATNKSTATICNEKLHLPAPGKQKW